VVSIINRKFIDLSSTRHWRLSPNSKLHQALTKLSAYICSTPQSYYRSYDEYIPLTGSPIHSSSQQSPQQQQQQQQQQPPVSNSLIQSPHSPSLMSSSSPSINHQYGYSTVLPTAIIASHQDVLAAESQQWNCGGSSVGGINGSPYQTEFCASNYSIMQRQQYGAKISQAASLKSIKEARIRRPMNGKQMSMKWNRHTIKCHLISPTSLFPSIQNQSFHGVG